MISRRKSPEYKLGIQYIQESEDGLCSLELAELLGIQKRNVNEYVKLWRADGLIYIHNWQLNGRSGSHAPCFKIRDNGQKDKRSPKPKSGAQRSKVYRLAQRLEASCSQ